MDSFLIKYKYQVMLYVFWGLFTFFLLPGTMGYLTSIVLSAIWPLSIIFVLFFGTLNIGPAFGVVIVGLFVFFIRFLFQMIGND